MKIDNLYAVAPRIAKIAPERWFEFQVVLAGNLLPHVGQLLFIPHHDPEMAHVRGLEFFHLENGEELVFAEFEKRIALAVGHLFKIENVLVKRDRFLDVIHLDGDVITSVNLHAHINAQH
ncbi:MAG: hypothetical protein AUH91_04550 [Verrucomicrobia bacterium 13_1_40CM_4_54_4]|nr:MAG: hypothetical protein AUH91_04550 [Verrucomicrobia bacterium 13_1_40CM_4_54_4]